MRKFRFWLLWALAPWAWAHSPVAPHEHGAAYIDLVSDNGVIDPLLRAPLASLVGFEQPPATAAHTLELEQALTALKQPNTLFATPNCHWQTLALQQQGAEHLEATAHYQAHCAPNTLSFNALFTRFSDLEQLKLQVLQGLGQNALTLTADHPLIELN